MAGWVIALLGILAVLLLWIVLAKLGAIRYIRKKLTGKKSSSSREEEPIAASIYKSSRTSGAVEEEETGRRSSSKSGRYSRVADV